MNRSLAGVSALLCLAPLAWAQNAPADSQGEAPTSQSWELRGRDWQPVAAPAGGAAASVSNPALDGVEALIERERGKEAFGEVVRWLKANPSAFDRDRGLLLTARALYASGDRIKAFYYCDELLDTYPESPFYQSAIELQYQIADAYLSGYKGKVLGLRVADMSDEAIEMLFRIQQRSPGSRLAEQALLRTADHYYAKGDYDLAGDAYAAYARGYTRSPEASRVRLRQAWAYLAQFRGLRFDATPVIDARAQLNDLLASNPELAREENVPQLLDRIDSTLAQKAMGTADYYRRSGQPRAAAYLYNSLIEAYPESPEAEKAKAALERLPAGVRDEAIAPPPAPTAMAR
jgi:outer membrane assembly lipoprotein YfiO